jgi:hypothetical protein
MLIKCGSCFSNCCCVNNCVTLASTKLRIPEDGTEALKHVGVFIKYFNVYVRAFVGINNKQYKIHSMYIKIRFLCFFHSTL